MNPLLMGAIIAGLMAIANIPFTLYLIRNSKMALNFNDLNAAIATNTTSVGALKTQAANSDDASNQASIDALTATVTANNEAMATLIIPPPVS